MSAHDVEASALVSRVERGELAREALELLSLLGHAAARRALGKLPLELTPPPSIVWPETDPPRQASSWNEAAYFLQALGRPVAVRFAVAVVDALGSGPLALREPSPMSHVGFHTGPHGILRVTEALATEVFPLGDVVRGTADAARAWLGDPTVGVAQRWPALLTARRPVQLVSDLAGVDWRAVWAVRWLVACATGSDREIGAAAASVASYAHAMLETASSIHASARETLTGPLLG